jgi:hypothetical protein
MAGLFMRQAHRDEAPGDEASIDDLLAALDQEAMEQGGEER